MTKKQKTTAAVLSCSAATAIVLRAFETFVTHQIFERGAVVPTFVFRQMNKKTESKFLAEDNVKWTNEQKFEDCYIENKRGQKLHAELLKAEEDSKVFVLCSHGYRSQGHFDFARQCRFLHGEGYNLLFVDHQACGKSDGQFISFGYYESIDLVQWARFLVTEFGEDIKIILYGISLGSATVMMSVGSGKLPKNCVFAIADCGYTSAKDEFIHNMKSWHIPVHPLLERIDRHNEHLAGWKLREVSPIDSVTNAEIPILFVHGDADTFVPTEMVYKLYSACSSEKDLLIVKHAPHAMSYKFGEEEYQLKIKEFAEKYL